MVVVHAWSFATDEDYCMVVVKKRRVFIMAKAQENLRMAEFGEWGTDLKVFLLSCMLDVNIVVHQNLDQVKHGS